MLSKIADGKIKSVAQNESAVTFTRKFATEDAFIDLQSGNQKENWLKIRALNPEPGTFTNLKLNSGKDLRLKILEADFENGKLELKIVQPEGKKPMSHSAFLNGYSKLLK